MTAVSFLVGVLSTTVSAATPLLLASLGEIVCERSGNLNLGVEGMMLAGALVGFLVAKQTGDPNLAFLLAVAAGVAMASIHAFLTISLKANQVISGIMLTLLGTGLTTFFGSTITQRSIDGMNKVTLPLVGQYLVEIPVLGPVFFRSHPPDFVALALVPVVWYFLFRTRFGLSLIAVGEDAETADTMGIPVTRTRYVAVLTGGAFAGAAGAYITVVLSNIWASGIVSGRGWIAIALVIFAHWSPWRALVGAYLFGFIDALAIRSDAVASQLSTTTGTFLDPIVGFVFNPAIMNIYPYLFTIVVLVLVSAQGTAKQLGAPADLKIPYLREAE